MRASSTPRWKKEVNPSAERIPVYCRSASQKPHSEFLRGLLAIWPPSGPPTRAALLSQLKVERIPRAHNSRKKPGLMSLEGGSLLGTGTHLILMAKAAP